MVNQPIRPAKTFQRLVLGIVLGAFLGAALAGLFLKLPLIQQNLAEIGFSFELVLGRFFAEHFYAVVTTSGAVVGMAVGGSLAVSKWWGIAVMGLCAGMAIGGAAIYAAEEKVVNWQSELCEDMAVSQRASAYLDALRAMDRAATN